MLARKISKIENESIVEKLEKNEAVLNQLA